VARYRQQSSYDTIIFLKGDSSAWPALSSITVVEYLGYLRGAEAVAICPRGGPHQVCGGRQVSCVTTEGLYPISVARWGEWRHMGGEGAGKVVEK
jgi:hypothetical protein